MAMHKKKYNNRTRKSKRSRKIKIDPIKVIKQNTEFRFEIASMIFFITIGILSLIEGVLNNQSLWEGILLVVLPAAGLTMNIIGMQSYRKNPSIEMRYNTFRIVTRILIFVMVGAITVVNGLTVQYEDGNSLWFVIGCGIAIIVYAIVSIWIGIMNKLKLKMVDQE